MVKNPFASNRALLGVDLGNRSLKLVQWNLRAGSLLHAHLLELNRGSPDWIKPVRQFLHEQGFRGMPVASCVEDIHTKIRKVEIPPMPENEMSEAVKWKMREVVEGGIDDYVIRYSRIEASSGKSAHQQVLVGYAIPKHAIQYLKTTLTSLDLQPVIIEPHSVTMAAGLEPLLPKNQNWVTLVDLGHRQSILVIIGRGRYYFSRPLPGIDHTLANEGLFKQKLAQEIQNSLDTFAVTFAHENIDALYLSGGRATQKGLCDYLSTNLGIPTQILNPFQNLMTDNRLGLPDKSHQFTQALALARYAA